MYVNVHVSKSLKEELAWAIEKRLRVVSNKMLFKTAIPYSGKILRAKIFEVDLLQNSLRIKFRGSTRLSLHLYAIIRFSRINFRGSSEIHEISEIYCPRKIPAIR